MLENKKKIVVLCSVAAAALYLSCVNNGERHTQKQIADAAGISTVTLRLRSESLSKTFDIVNLLTNSK